MELTDEDIKEYRKIWKEEFKEEISKADARASASQVLELYFQLWKKNHQQRSYR
jgi:hypothetical protein